MQLFCTTPKLSFLHDSTRVGFPSRWCASAQRDYICGWFLVHARGKPRYSLAEPCFPGKGVAPLSLAESARKGKGASPTCVACTEKSLSLRAIMSVGFRACLYFNIALAS